MYGTTYASCMHSRFSTPSTIDLDTAMTPASSLTPRYGSRCGEPASCSSVNGKVLKSCSILSSCLRWGRVRVTARVRVRVGVTIIEELAVGLDWTATSPNRVLATIPSFAAALPPPRQRLSSAPPRSPMARVPPCERLRPPLFRALRALPDAFACLEVSAHCEHFGS